MGNASMMKCLASFVVLCRKGEQWMLLQKVMMTDTSPAKKKRIRSCKRNSLEVVDSQWKSYSCQSKDLSMVSLCCMSP